MEEPLSEPVFDRDAILTIVEGDIEFLGEIVELFFDDLPGMLADIRDSVVRRDSKALESAAHALKGSVGNFGAKYARNAALNLEVLGYSDNLGENYYNMWISQRRSNRVIDYLVERGIEVNRMSAKWFGEDNQAMSCEDCSEEQHQANRRVELILQ